MREARHTGAGGSRQQHRPSRNGRRPASSYGYNISCVCLLEIGEGGGLREATATHSIFGKTENFIMVEIDVSHVRLRQVRSREVADWEKC